MDSSMIFTENKKVSTKFLAVVFGYMFLGLFLTAVTGFVFSWAIVKAFGTNVNGVLTLNEQGFSVVLVSCISAFVVALIDSFAMSIFSLKTGRAPWAGYIVYALCLGIGFSVILLANVDFGTVGEAFGITAGIFLVLFLIGYFSPVNLSPLAFVGIGLLVGLFLVGSVFGIWALAVTLSGGTLPSYYLFDLVSSVVIVIIAMLFTAYDANRMGEIAEKGMATQNVALFCAFDLYGDFVMLFIRILYLLLAAKSRN
jgi:FtsH-binding integral membrane protein